MNSAFTIGSCVCGTACHCLCAACSACGATPKVFARLGYIMFALLWIVLSVIFLFYGHYIFKLPFSDILGCDETNAQVCIGVSAVYRTSFTLMVFHFLMCLFCTCGGEIVSKLNEGAWPIKFTFVFLVFVLTFFIPNNFFKGYGYCAMVGSFFFVVYEMILVIDMAYAWNSAWVGNFDSNGSNGSSTCWAITLILGTIVAMGGGIAVYVVLFMDLAKSTSDYLIIGLPIFAAVIYIVLTVIPIVEGGSIFTCALVFFFGSFITSSIMLINPEDKNGDYLVLQIVIGVGFLFFVLFYVGVKTEKSATSASDSKPAAQQASDKVAGAIAETDDSSDKTPILSGRNGASEDQVQPVSAKTALFHLLMAFASLYYSMLLSNWGSPSINKENWPDGFLNPWLGFGVMLAAQWLGILFFIWSLIAPRICPDRDFS